MNSAPNRSRGYAAVFATVVIWSLPSVFQFYLNRYYDPWSQNFYRYAVGCLTVAPFVFNRFWRKGPRIDRRAVAQCFVPVVPNVVHQITQTIALLYMGPGMIAIFGRSSVIVTALLALLFFADERAVIRQWQFVAGTSLGLLGAFGVFWFQRSAGAEHFALRGFAFAITATIGWALYGILVKRPAATLGPIRSFGLISFLTSAALLPLMFIWGKPATPLHVGWQVNAILILSAVTCISAAHLLYYVAIRELGVALAQTLQLLCPVGALGLSALIFGERLGHAQLWSAAILLAGAFLAMQARPTAVADPGIE
jgi:drug/metabolite transporter (DMT)-like permease